MPNPTCRKCGADILSEARAYNAELSRVARTLRLGPPNETRSKMSVAARAQVWTCKACGRGQRSVNKPCRYCGALPA